MPEPAPEEFYAEPDVEGNLASDTGTALPSSAPSAFLTAARAEVEEALDKLGMSYDLPTRKEFGTGGGWKWQTSCFNNSEHNDAFVVVAPAANGVGNVKNFRCPQCVGTDWLALSVALIGGKKCPAAIQDGQEHDVELPREWPAPPGPEVYQGLVGEFVRMWEPHTEADEIALAVQFLVTFGSAVGRGPFYAVAGDNHRTNLNLLLVGATAEGRKGQSQNCIEYTFSLLPPINLPGKFGGVMQPVRSMSGLSTGEGLVMQVRDRVHGIDKQGKAVIDDPGIEDKRLLVVETEFGRVLTVLRRENNTLSALIRQAWDGKTLGVLTKTNAMQANDAHISQIDHVTREDLLRNIDDIQLANGFLNRYGLVCSRRIKLLDDPGRPPREVLEPLVRKLQETIEFAVGVQEMKRDAEARALWKEMYPELERPRVGRLVNQVVRRASPITLRLSMIYALLDRSDTIRAEHLRSARALWEYMEASAVYVFGDSLGDRVAEKILELLAEPEARRVGMSTTQIRNKIADKTQVPNALLRLVYELRRVRMEDSRQGGSRGRKGQRWFLIDEASSGVEGSELMT